jgi:hypothetical protein
MKKTSNADFCDSIALVSEKRSLGRQYKLYEIFITGGCFYAVCIRDGKNVCTEAFFGKEQEVRELFEVICEGSLSTEHLSDIAEDFRHTLIC